MLSLCRCSADFLCDVTHHDVWHILAWGMPYPTQCVPPPQEGILFAPTCHCHLSPCCPLLPAGMLLNLCLQVSSCSVAIPGRPVADLVSYTSKSAGGGSTTGGASSNATAAVTIVDLSANDLQVVVAAPAAAAAASNGSAAPTPAPINLAKIVDTTPPVITMSGSSYMPVTQLDIFTDPGVTVYDNIDGNSLAAVTRLQLCTRPAANLSTLAANDTTALAGCGQQLAVLNTSVPSRSNETYVLTYTARDLAGNPAVPLRRYVTVKAK